MTKRNQMTLFDIRSELNWLRAEFDVAFTSLSERIRDGRETRWLIGRIEDLKIELAHLEREAAKLAA